MQLQLDEVIADSLASPLSFVAETGGLARETPAPVLDPLVARPDQAMACKAPAPSITCGTQMAAVTQRVQRMTIAAPASKGLFCAPEPAILAAPSRPSAPQKSRAPSAPARQSARQAAKGCKVPVANRAALRLVQEMGMLGPKERMTAAATEALIRRFNEPLSEEYIQAISKLLRLDVSALRVVAGLMGPDGADVTAA